MSTQNLSPWLLAYQKDGWYLCQLWHTSLFPFTYGACVYPFVWGGNTSCYAHASVGTQSGTEGVEHLAVAIGSLDEELCLSFCPCTRFELLQALGTVSVLNGQITAEGETLSAKTRGHDGKNHAAGTNERNNTDATLLGYGNDVGTGIGNGRATSLADDTHGVSLGNGSKVFGKAGCVGMLTHLEEGAIVYGELTIHAAQETACRAYLLYDEVADVTNHLCIVGGKYILVRSVAKGDRDEVKGWGGVIVVCHKFI